MFSSATLQKNRLNISSASLVRRVGPLAPRLCVRMLGLRFRLGAPPRYSASPLFAMAVHHIRITILMHITNGTVTPYVVATSKRDIRETSHGSNSKMTGSASS